MHNACLNLCRIKTRDQLTLDRIGYLTQFPQYPDKKFDDFVPRSGNQEGSGVLGWTYKCKGWETDPNAYVYIILQRGPKQFELACKAFGFEDWLTFIHEPVLQTVVPILQPQPERWCRSLKIQPVALRYSHIP